LANTSKRNNPIILQDLHSFPSYYETRGRNHSSENYEKYLVIKGNKSLENIDKAKSCFLSDAD